MVKDVMSRKEGDKYISDSISLESSDIVLHVELKDNGNIVLERSITGDNWVVAAYLARNVKLYENGVVGKSGQIVRIVSTIEISKISILQ
jgi:hypothetical protein